MKHREIKDIDKYIALDILLELGSLDNMVITYSKPKDFLVGSGKGFITSPGVKANVDPKKCKKASYTVEYFSMKDLSNIIREFENLPYKGYERKRPKHQHTDSYFYLARQLAKCVMRDDSLNLDIYPLRMEITGTQ